MDYKWIKALDAVISCGSFERAASQLNITQSAVSQRVKQLEKFISQPVLIRVNPIALTPVGRKLVELNRKVQMLEQELVPDLMNQAIQRPVSIAIAANSDSLATWLLPALSELLLSKNIELTIQTDIESRALDKLKNGEVAGSISIYPEPLSGCASEYLGCMEYLCVATPGFFHHYFASGVNQAALAKAPIVRFNQYDTMHVDFLTKHFDVNPRTLHQHYVASSEAFVKFALAGVACCLIPRMQIEDDLKAGNLIEVTPGITHINHVYWHHWQLETGLLKQMTQAILKYGKSNLMH
jgi:LysR family transcriptional regulator (chromosome initiation inhibitor)